MHPVHERDRPAGAMDPPVHPVHERDRPAGAMDPPVHPVMIVANIVHLASGADKMVRLMS